jgi:type VI secretion system secreted protein Hcp
MSYSHGITLPMTIDQKTSKRTAGTAQASLVSVSKRMDQSSPAFAQRCIDATNLGLVTIVLLQETAGKVQEMMKYELSDTLVASYSCGGGGGIPTETITLSYSKIHGKYQVQKTDATIDGLVQFTFEVTTNTASAT